MAFQCITDIRMNVRKSSWFCLVLGSGVLLWQLARARNDPDLGSGIRFVEKVQIGPRCLTARLVSFDEAKVQVRVVMNESKKEAKNLSEWGKESGALAVCNGGYFEVPNLLPAGLEISNGVRRGERVSQPGAGGALVVKNGKPALIWDEEFQDDPTIEQLVQCSPWLVKDGKPWPLPPAETREPKNARTFVATDGEGKWVIGTIKGVGLAELAQLLVTPGAITEFPVKRALNLDGGPSTGLWFRTPGGVENYEKPGWIVRNGLAILAR